MPKPKSKASIAYFERQHTKIQSTLDQGLQAIQGNIRTIRARENEINKRKARTIKHVQLRNLFLKVSKPAELDKTAQVIDEAIKNAGESQNEPVSRGQKWRDEFVDNVFELCRLADVAIAHSNKKASEKENQAKTVMDLQKKVDEFQNSVLVKVQEFCNENKKPYQVTPKNDSGNDYLCTKTPFQIYRS